MKVAVNAQQKTVSVSYADEGESVLLEDTIRPCAYLDRALFGDASEAKRVWVQLGKVGAFKGHSAGEFALTPQVFDEIVGNFKATSNRAIPIDFEHASEADAAEGDIPTRGAPAQGWITNLDNRGQNGLWGEVEWGQLASGYIKQGQYKFISPAIRFGAKDRVTGLPIGARMTSAGLTNKPFLDGMAPMAAKDSSDSVLETDRDLQDVAAAIAAALSDNTPAPPANEESTTMSDATETAETRLKLKDAESRVTSLEAEVKLLRDEKVKRDDEELHAEVEAAYLTNKDVKRLSDSDKADMFILARASRDSFRKLFPSVPAHQRHLTQDVASNGADKGDVGERKVVSRDDVPSVVALVDKYQKEKGMSLEDATLKAYDKVMRAEAAYRAQGGRLAMAIYNQMSATPVQGGDFVFHNYSGTDIPPGTAVLIDTVNLSLINQTVGVTVALSAGNPAGACGVTMEVLKAGRDGRVRVLGTAIASADGAINPGDPVMLSTNGAKLGRVTKSTGPTAMGQSLSQAADADPVVVFLTPQGSGLAQVGSAVLVAGTVTVLTGIAITANSKVFLSRSLTGGTPGHLSYTVVVGAFGVAQLVITSSSGTDTSTIVYEIVGLAERETNMAKQKIQMLDAGRAFAGTGVKAMTDFDPDSRTATYADGGGRLVKMDLGQSDVHIEKALANYAAGFRLQQGLADTVSPVLPTTNASDKYFQWDKLDAFQPVQDIVASPGATVKQVNPRLSNTLFTTIGYAVGAFIPTEIMANADNPLAPQLNAMQRCMNVLIQAREARVGALLTTAANFDPSVVITEPALNKWNGGASSDPINDIYTIMEKSLQPVTHMVMSERVWHSFVKNAQVQKFTQAKFNVPGLPGQPTDIQGTNALLGLPQILVAAMKTLTAANIYDYVWGNDVAFVHQEVNAPKDGMTIATSFTFRWTGAQSQDTTMQGGFQVRSFFNQFKGPRGGVEIVVTHNDAEVITSNIVGGVIKAAWQLACREGILTWQSEDSRFYTVPSQSRTRPATAASGSPSATLRNGRKRIWRSRWHSEWPRCFPTPPRRSSKRGSEARDRGRVRQWRGGPRIFRRRIGPVRGACRARGQEPA